MNNTTKTDIKGSTPTSNDYKTNKTKIKQNIIENIVYVKTNYLKSKIDWIFKNLYKPENPTKIISEEKTN